MSMNATAVLVWGFPLSDEVVEDLNDRYEDLHDLLDDDGHIVVGGYEDWSPVFAAGWSQKVDWGPKQIIFPQVNSTDLITELVSFCRRHNIPWQTPGWYLSAYYG